MCQSVFMKRNPALISNNGVNSDIAQKKFGIGGSPREAEIDLIARDLDIALKQVLFLTYSISVRKRA